MVEYPPLAPGPQILWPKISIHALTNYRSISTVVFFSINISVRPPPQKKNQLNRQFIFFCRIFLFETNGESFRCGLLWGGWVVETVATK